MLQLLRPHHTDRYQGAGAFESEPPADLRMHRLLLPLTNEGFRCGLRIFMESIAFPRRTTHELEPGPAPSDVSIVPEPTERV